MSILWLEGGAQLRKNVIIKVSNEYKYKWDDAALVDV